MAEEKIGHPYSPASDKLKATAKADGAKVTWISENELRNNTPTKLIKSIYGNAVQIFKRPGDDGRILMEGTAYYVTLSEEGDDSPRSALRICSTRGEDMTVSLDKIREIHLEDFSDQVADPVDVFLCDNIDSVFHEKFPEYNYYRKENNNNFGEISDKLWTALTEKMFEEWNKKKIYTCARRNFLEYCGTDSIISDKEFADYKESIGRILTEPDSMRVDEAIALCSARLKDTLEWALGEWENEGRVFEADDVEKRDLSDYCRVVATSGYKHDKRTGHFESLEEDAFYNAKELLPSKKKADELLKWRSSNINEVVPADVYEARISRLPDDARYFLERNFEEGDKDGSSKFMYFGGSKCESPERNAAMLAVKCSEIAFGNEDMAKDIFKGSAYGDDMKEETVDLMIHNAVAFRKKYGTKVSDNKSKKALSTKEQFRRTCAAKGYTFTEMSEKLGVSEPTLRSRVNNDTLTVRDLRAIQGILDLENSDMLEMFLKKRTNEKETSRANAQSK